MGSNIYTDKELTRLFEKDARDLVPDAAVRQRLEYTFMLKCSGAKVKQNSFLGMFSWLFSWSHLPLKAAMVSIILVVSLLKMPNVEQQFLLPGQDTTFNTIPLLIDTSETSPFFADTCFTTNTSKKKSGKTQHSFSEFDVANKNDGIISQSAPHNIFSTAVPAFLFLNRHPVLRRSAPADLNKSARVESHLLA